MVPHVLYDADGDILGEGGGEVRYSEYLLLWRETRVILSSYCVNRPGYHCFFSRSPTYKRYIKYTQVDCHGEPSSSGVNHVFFSMFRRRVSHFFRPMVGYDGRYSGSPSGGEYDASL